jgi:transcriptional regulator with XRE-family HTH domain
VTRPGRRKREDSPYAEQAQRVASRLRSLREQAGLSQEQLAARTGLAVGTVRKIETGVVTEPGFFTVMTLLRILGARAEDMIT